MRSLAEAYVSERCYRRQYDSQPRFDKRVPSKVSFIISMFSNGSFTPGPELTRGLHTFDLMQKCCFCICRLMLTRCYDVSVANGKQVIALTLFKLSLIFGDSWWVFLNSTSRKTKTKHLKAQRSLSSVQQNQQVIEFRALHDLS